MNDLQLRPWRKEDAQALANLANNKNIWNNVMDSFPSPYTVLDALQWVNREANANPITKFAIEFNGKLVGGIGMMMHEDVYRCNVELGYFIGELYWGKGIGTKAIEAIVQHIIQTQPQVTRIFARVYAYNKGSMRALEKNGFVLESIQQRAAVKNNEVINVHMWVKLV
jgi:RimJ/RimL family protein N-acetyltransferase